MTFPSKIGTIVIISTECRIFFFNQLSHSSIKPWWILSLRKIVSCGIKITNNVRNSFGESTNFFIDSSF